jgi:hypothetical protein
MPFSEAVDIEKQEAHGSRCHSEPAVGRSSRAGHGHQEPSRGKNVCGRLSGSAGEESLLKFWCQLVAAPCLQLVILSEVAAIVRRPFCGRAATKSKNLSAVSDECSSVFANAA